MLWARCLLGFEHGRDDYWCDSHQVLLWERNDGRIVQAVFSGSGAVCFSINVVEKHDLAGAPHDRQNWPWEVGNRRIK